MALTTQGPLSLADLLSVWEGAVDKSYSDPLKSAGLGNGFEAIQQMLAQFARVSLAIDVSLQGMYIQPFSGQTAPPASFEAFATVTLTISRAGYLGNPLVLGAGQIVVDEETTDADDDGPVTISTGRRYMLTETLVFMPGEQGPFDVEAQATLPGYGFNNPLPGTISLVEQVGSGFFNSGAQVSSAITAAPPVSPAPITTPVNLVQLITENTADTLIPEHVGQYVLFTLGANKGQIGRIASFLPPDPTAISVNFPAGLGSIGALDQLVTFSQEGLPTGSFEIGERIDFKTGGGTMTGVGSLLGVSLDALANRSRFAVLLVQGSIAGATRAFGESSGEIASIDTLFFDGTFVDESPTAGVGGASWRVLDWAQDWQLVVTNVRSPAGGKLGMLNLLGEERGLPQQQGESEEDYRERIWQVADQVTPNAIRRSLSRNLGAIPWCFREVGTQRLPGFYYDRVDDPEGDFYDWGTLLFTHASSTGSFLHQEPCEYRQNGLPVLWGFWGSYLNNVGVATAITAASGRDFPLVITRGKDQSNFPSVVQQAGDVIVGLRSGATFTPAGILFNAWPGLKRFHSILDYTNMRAYFTVGVPPADGGDFGFAYDDHPHGAYDTTPFTNGYDGFPFATAAFYARLYNAVDAIRAGGVSWDLYQIAEPCD